ncbi:potassium channel family protein [Virgibacillus xinjiangensis]|uniref:Potassium channel family protein n=1 Tax=Virgibacillus xinjiangensis TaxID=393090 RepID=A0ABV7CSA2_9BACI
MIPWLALLLTFLAIIISIFQFIRGGKRRPPFELREGRFSAEIFYAFLIIYVSVLLGFGLIYFILSFQGIILVEDGELRQPSVIGSLIHSMYFSGVTLLTIGYGDITPVGLGRLIALIQALIGYIIPAAFVLKLVQSQQRSRSE